MVLNKRGGKNAKKQKSSGTRPQGRALVLRDSSPESCELYGKVVKRLGGNPPQILVLCEDGTERNCVVRGKMCKRVWMNPNDFVIILYNKESNELKGEVQYKYEQNEVSKLEKQGEITLSKFQLSTDIFNNNNNDDIIFGEEDDDINENVDGVTAKSSGLADLDNMDVDDDDFEDEFDINDI